MYMADRLADRMVAQSVGNLLIGSASNKTRDTASEWFCGLCCQIMNRSFALLWEMAFGGKGDASIAFHGEFFKSRCKCFVHVCVGSRGRDGPCVSFCKWG